MAEPDAFRGGGRKPPTSRQVEALVRSGCVTPDEADRLLGAEEAGETEETMTLVRLRHAGARLDALVADGRISSGEADDLLDRIRRGEHSPTLRAQIRGLERGDGMGLPPLAKGDQP